MLTTDHALRQAEAEHQLNRIHREPRQYGFLEELACHFGRHDYDGLCGIDGAGRLVRSCLRPGCAKVQRLTPPVVGPS